LGIREVITNRISQILQTRHFTISSSFLQILSNMLAICHWSDRSLRRLAR